MRILILLFFSSIAVLAHSAEPLPLYQVDLVVFAQDNQSKNTQEDALSPVVLTDTAKAVALQPYDGLPTPYHLQPPSTSQLKKELWALKNKGPYQILGHYTWLQPENSQRPVILPELNLDNWHMEGTVRVRKSTYFMLDSELLFSTSSNPDSPFVFSQKHRLEDEKVYYLDHPQIGLLIKIHKLA